MYNLTVIGDVMEHAWDHGMVWVVHQESNHMMWFLGIKSCCGVHCNYAVDADDNVMLDLFGQISTLPLGICNYNYPSCVVFRLNI